MDQTMTVSSNGGSLTTNSKAYIKNYGKVWFNKQAITNVLSLKLVHNKFKMTYDGDSDKSIFTIQKLDGKQVHFWMHSDSLHYHNPKKQEMALISTIKDNEEGFTPHQIASAKAACKLQATVGYPSISDLKAILKSNQVANCPITITEVNCTRQIYRPSVPMLKGKTVHCAPTPVVCDYIAVPSQILLANQQVILSGNIFFVNKIPFLTTISENIHLTTMLYLQNCKASTILKGLVKVWAIYAK